MSAQHLVRIYFDMFYCILMRLDEFQHHSDHPMSLFTSILKNIAEETIPKISAVPKRLNKPWFSDICKDAIKERNRAHERFKREPTEGNLNAYRIARAKARRDA